MKRNEELAFERIKCCMIAEGYTDNDTFQDFAIIEGSLNDYWRLLKEEDETTKKLKALENIKEKDVDVGWLKRAKDLHAYNNGMGIGSYSALTKEAYDLLKEALM